MFSCIFFDAGAGDGVLGENIDDSVVDPVVVTFCEGADLRPTIRRVQETDFFLSSESDGLEFQVFFTQSIDGGLGKLAGGGAGGQVKDFFNFVFTHCLDGREDGGHSFTDPCRCLCEEFFTARDGPISSYRKFPLSFSVGCKGKINGFDRLGSQNGPFTKRFCPCEISMNNVIKKSGQFR